jgi:hypothetical protein
MMLEAKRGEGGCAYVLDWAAAGLGAGFWGSRTWQEALVTGMLFAFLGAIVALVWMIVRSSFFPSGKQ